MTEQVAQGVDANGTLYFRPTRTVDGETQYHGSIVTAAQFGEFREYYTATNPGASEDDITFIPATQDEVDSAIANAQAEREDDPFAQLAEMLGISQDELEQMILEDNEVRQSQQE